MARKKRKILARNRKKKSKTTTKKSWRKLRKRRPQRSLGSKVRGAYRTVVDTIKDTDQLRNKLELPATSETE